MVEKKVMITRYYDVSQALNISYTITKQIVDSYIKYCKNELLRHKRVDILGVVSIIPSNEVFDYKTTISYIYNVVAKENGFTYSTVNTVMTEFFSTAKKDILSGKITTIRGLVTLHPLLVDGELSVVHASISRTLQDFLKEKGSSARVHTNKVLKKLVKECG